MVTQLLAGNALHHLRAAQAILRFADTYGTERLDAACQRALAVGDPSYRTVKGILAAGLERDPLPEQLTLPSPRVTATPALLRGPDALVGHLVPAAASDASDAASHDRQAAPSHLHDPHHPGAPDAQGGQDREGAPDRAGQRREPDHDRQGVAG
jgi:hypothetical protein